MKLGKIHMTLAMYRKGLEYVDKAKDILTVAMGPKHPFVARELFALEQMAEEDPEIAIENKIARTEKKLKEICPCCGKPKSVHQKVKKEVERPWERDRMLIRELKQDSEYFNTNDYIYWPSFMNSLYCYLLICYSDMNRVSTYSLTEHEEQYF